MTDSIAAIEPEAVALRASALSLWFGDHQVLDGIDIAIPARQVTALIGPSGSGKTSLLRCFNRLNDEVDGARSNGRVELAGVDVRSAALPVHELRRRVGMVFQRPNPFPLSIADNVGFGLRLLGLSRGSERDDRIESALRAAGLWDEVSDQLDRPALRLSLGQQQRLVIARALAVEPDVLLMDEPSSALDPLSTLRFEELVHTLVERHTIVLVTHNIQQAARVSDCTAYLHGGRLIEFGRSDGVFTQPRERQTEDYLTGRYA